MHIIPSEPNRNLTKQLSALFKLIIIYTYSILLYSYAKAYM